ncbi:Gldg family protein [Xanthomonadaceae bacterium JHOS43]|nr:Gldg family protein [Xanthomonadaceae bacterium JHOS43]
MNLTQRRLSTGVALLALAILFIALVVLTGHLFRGARMDLTEHRLYTLTDGTTAILSKLDEPVNLTYYYSEHAARDLPQLRTYAGRVRELLEEMAARSGGKLRLAVIDPQPFSEDEDRATAMGLQAVPVGNAGDTLFFGLAGTNAIGNEATIPFFQPDKEAFLEYDVAKLVSSLASDTRPVVGVMSTLPMGPSFDPSAGRPSPGWVIDGEMRNLFQIQRVETDVTAIPDEVKALVVVHPRHLSSDTLYAIDQFVLRGGHLLAFVDPDAEAQTPATGADPTQAMLDDASSDLPELFAAWGVSYDPGRVVLDAQRALEIQLQQGTPPVRHPGVIGLSRDDANPDDVVTAQLGTINLSSVGSFGLADNAKVRLEPLLQSSANASTTDAQRLRHSTNPAQLYADFSPTGERYAIAVRLIGTLDSAFPDRQGDGHLAQSTDPANIVLVADTDLLSDRLWAQVQQFFGQRVVNAFASNGDFVINAIDNLIGSADLIAVRTRAGSSRPFTTVDALRVEADARFRAKERELQARLQETEEKLAALQQTQPGGNALTLSAEQQTELLRFQDEKLRIRKDLRQVRRQLDEDIQALGGKLKFLNIAGVPLLLTFGALGFVGWRARQRRIAA